MSTLDAKAELPPPSSAGATRRAPATRAQRRHHIEALSLAVAVIVLSLALQVQGDRVAFWFLPDHPLPQVCMSRAYLHVNCPGCGLTRSFVHLAHGQWESAYRSHHLGVLLAFFTVIQIPYRLLSLRFGTILRPGEARWILSILALALIANWVMGLLIR